MDDTRLKASIMAALLAGAGAASFLYFARAVPATGPAPRADEFTVANARSAMVSCREAVQMTFDVHWAAACQAQAGSAGADGADSSAECDLPDARAAVVNAWLDEAERRCSAEGRNP